LPLLNQNPAAVRAQLLVAVTQHAEGFGAPPRGLWLPECGYFPGLDHFLGQAGIRYTFVETHAIDHAPERVDHGVHAPLRSPAGVAFFGRDPESTRQVWSSSEGYPGDPDYREYYRDAGFELEPQALGDLVHPLGIRRNLGIKYHRVTGATEAKEPYVRARADARGRACRALLLETKASGRCARRADGARTDCRCPLRRRAIWPLVVRRPRMAGRCAAQVRAGRRGARAFDTFRLFEREPREPTSHARNVEPGLQGLQRNVVEREE